MIDTHAPVAISPTSPHRPRRGRMSTFGLSAAVLLALCTLAGWRLVDRMHHDYLGPGGWPTHGQAAYQVGTAPVRASAAQRPVPIASVTKVMTALIVLRAHPLADASVGGSRAAGPTLLVSMRDVADTAERRRQDQSVVPVRAGERLTERQALEALMLPSANNMAVLLARFTSGSAPRFVALMNREAARLGMRHTQYTDPSGYDATTVSTAADQLLLARAAAADATLADLMSTSSARLPVVGVVHNTDTLLGTDGFDGMKTGSDDAAGGCFMFSSWRVVDHQVVQVVGVVLGQPGHNLIEAGLTAARQLVDRMTPVAAHA